MSLGGRAITWAVVAAMAAFMIGAVACGSSSQPAASPTAAETPTAAESATPSPTVEPSGTLDGATLVQERCTQCHTLDRVAAEDGDAAKWTAIVNEMIANGASLNDQEKQAVIDYLAAEYPDQ
jgi:cytochrome c5